MRKASIGPIVLLFLFSLTLSVLRADDLPEHLRIKGAADTLLAGIDVYKSTVREAIIKLGKPTKVIDYPETGPVAGERDYEWEEGQLKLTCGTWYDKGDESVIYSVEVWGKNADGRMGSTGRGLALGSTISEIHRIYGRRMLVNRLENGIVQVTIQWRDDTTLYLFLSKSGHLNHIHLLAATE